MDDILKAVNEANTTITFMTSTTPPESPPHHSVQVYDKKTVPSMLDSFLCHDEDYFAWRESTINKLGIVACGRFVADDEQTPGKHPKVKNT